jgi:hypothetical protein
MNNAVFWDVTTCGSCKNRGSGPILVTLMMEALRSFDSLVLTRATRHKIPEDDIIQKVCLLSFSLITHITTLLRLTRLGFPTGSFV